MREVASVHRLTVPRDKRAASRLRGSSLKSRVPPPPNPALKNPADGRPTFSGMFLESKSLIHKLLFYCLDHLPHKSICSYFLFPQELGFCGTSQEALLSSESNPGPPHPLRFLLHPQGTAGGPSQDSGEMQCHEGHVTG